MLDEKRSTAVISEILLGQLKGLSRGAAPGGAAPGGPAALGLSLSGRRCELLDALLIDAFAKIPPCGAALAAVGSYGRGTPALGSDVDVRILLPEGADASGLAEQMLYPLWDAGVQVGHQIVTAAELLDLASSDLPTATALLDWRHLAGDPGASQRLVGQARQALVSGGAARLVGWLAGETAERHERFGGSVYLLEPDVKNGEGGLRDLDVAGWLAQAQGEGAGLSALEAEGLVAPAELARLQGARELLARVRNLLHGAAGRRADRLTFEMQEAIAPRLGYDLQAREMLGEGDDEARLSVAVEAFMSDYYRHAQLVARVLERLLRRARPLMATPSAFRAATPPSLSEAGGQLDLAPGHDLRADPAAALRLYAEAVRLGLPVSARARELVAQAAHDEEFSKNLRHTPEASSLFLRLCVDAAETPQLGRPVMDELREVGLLLAMIPEFLPVVGRVHHDVYHVYTVDVHSVAALDRLKALTRGELAEQLPLACRLAAEVLQPEVLHLATLLHDVGKALGGHDHANRGAVMGLAIARRLGLKEAQCDQVAHLIRAHLSMYHVATRRDLDDPSTLDEFSRDLRGREDLRELYLLTVADISTTSPTALSAWKSKLLEDLFLAADARLLGQAGQGVDEGRARQAHDDALARAGATDFARSFLASMPARYLLANPAEAAAMHIEVAHRASASAGGLACGLRALATPGLAELCVVALDRPGLLASIAAAIVACRLEVHGAQILSHPLDDGRVQAVDLFWVRGAALDHLPRLRSALDERLADYIDRRKPVASALEARGASPWASRRTPTIPTEVSIDDRSSPAAAIVEVVTRDRPGVLCALSLAFHRLGLSISLAKINTEGTRVADVFYVTDDGGSKIELLPRKNEIRAAITDILARLAPSPP